MNNTKECQELEFYKKQALELLKNTFLTEICWEVSCNNKDFKKNVIEVFRTEEEAKNMVTAMNNEEFDSMCYRPCVICKDEGIDVTIENLFYFHNESDFVKNLRKDLDFL